MSVQSWPGMLGEGGGSRAGGGEGGGGIGGGMGGGSGSGGEGGGGAAVPSSSITKVGAYPLYSSELVTTPMARALVCACAALALPHASTVLPVLQSSSTAFHCNSDGVKVTNWELKLRRR